MQGCFAKINRENKVEFYLLNNPSGEYEQISANSMNSKLEINNKYGPVNVVSFTMKNIEGENVTLKDKSSIAQYGETTIEVQDNPFMVNQNARELAISELYGSLVGFEYIPTVFNYKARLYNDCGDKIQVYDVDSESYVNSLILNQTIEVPTTRKSKMENKALSKTQVKNQYISKTEQEGSHTEIMVDKQNQQITSVVSQVTEQNSKISKINQRVDEISAQISDIADITTYGESSYASVDLDDVNASEPVMLKIHPITDNISYLYPSNFLFPSNLTFLKSRKVRFTNTDSYIESINQYYIANKQYYEYDNNTEQYILLIEGDDYNVGDAISGTVYEHEYFDYELPNDLLYYNQDVYDEFYLDYESHTCQVTKRCGYNADGTVYELADEVIIDYEYPTIQITEGDYEVSILGYEYGYIYIRLMAKNIYTDQFYTKAETNSLVDQTADNITLSVNQTLTNYSTTSQMNSAINVKAGEITSIVATKVGKNEVISEINQTSEQVKINANKIGLTANNVLDILAGSTINMTTKELTISSNKFNVDKNGNVVCNNLTVTGGSITGGTIDLKVEDVGGVDFFRMRAPSHSAVTLFSGRNIQWKNTNQALPVIDIGLMSNQATGYIDLAGDLTCNDIWCDTVHTSSLFEKKKNFEKLNNALDIINQTEIYKYNLKTEEDGTKKHIGFVIGDDYKYSKELTSKDNDSVDIYSVASVCIKSIQELNTIVKKQEEEINKLKEEIKKLKEGK